MLIFAIDDEPRALRVLHNAIAEAAPDAQIMDFDLGASAVEAITQRGLAPNVVFSDIQMPRLDGLALAARIRVASPFTRMVFVTAYSEYALDAIRARVSGYVMKPVTAGDVREELEYIAPTPAALPDGLWVRCFGTFEVFWNRRPLLFARRQTKELFAYLIDRQGGVCTTEEIASALWEAETNLSAAQNRIRQLVKDLKKTLSDIGMEDLLVRGRGQVGLVSDNIPCDYYSMIRGEMRWVNAWCGEYMTQYSWAEMTEAKLHFR